MSNSRETHPDRSKPWYRWCVKVARRVLVYFLGILLLLSIMQREMLYVPSHVPQLPVSEAGGLPGGGEHVALQTADGLQLHGWHLLPQPLTAANAGEFDHHLAAGKKVLLFFHGNGGHRGHRDLDYQVLTRLGVHVFAFDYRGYGENPGKPTEEKFAADARDMWKYVSETRRVAPDRIILYGESLGGGVATRLAGELCAAGTPPGGLILLSTFSSMIDAAGYHYPWLPVCWILKDTYRSDFSIPRMTAPLLMLHGARDDVIPMRLGAKLFGLAPPQSANGIPKTFVELKRAGHNDVLLADPAQFEEGIEKFLQSLP